MKVYDKLEQSFALLGLDLTVDNFSERKRLQKIIYLLEESGINFGFGFSWYIYGPYSPSLTKVVYKDSEEAEKDVIIEKNYKKRVLELKQALGRDILSSDTLELIASLHYLISLGRQQKRTDIEIIKLFRELKPFFSEEDTKYYFKMVNSMIEKGILKK